VLTLEIIRGAAARPSFELPAAVVTIGRAATNSVALTDYHLSGEHAQVVRDPTGYRFRDLRSTNGSAIERAGVRIAVDGKIGHELALHPGDLLLLGDPKSPVVIRVGFVPPPPVEPAGSDDELADRLIASRSIIDLPAVRDQIEHDPGSALRIYKALQRLSGRLEHAAVLDAITEATFEILPRATHVTILLRAEGDKDRFTLASQRARRRCGWPAPRRRSIRCAPAGPSCAGCWPTAPRSSPPTPSARSRRPSRSWAARSRA
jgi:hypothetical protein